jgi:hypothetical protein
MTHAEIIASLGDTKAVATRLGCKESAVSNWKDRGIPWRWRPEIARWAKEERLLLPADFLVQL